MGMMGAKWHFVIVALAAQACRASGDAVGPIDAGGFAGADAAGASAGKSGGGGGAGGVGGRVGSDAGGAGGLVVGPDVSGRWAMFAFEDPVAVELHAAGGVIGGEGCCGGLPSGSEPRLPLDCCGSVDGQISSQHATFWLTFGLGGGPPVATYWTDAFVSANGQRMTGRFMTMIPATPIGTSGFPVTWVRIGPTDNWLPRRRDTDVERIVATRPGGYSLVLSDGAAAGNDFAAKQTYRLDVGYRYVSGDLGVFWDGEMSWNAADQTLVVGPVPETERRLPVALRLHFDGTVVRSVEADMPSGAQYQFQATLLQP